MNHRLTTFALFLSLISTQLITAQDEKSDVELKTLKQKASYLVGFDIGEDILRRELDVDYQLIIRGIMDAVSKKKPPMTKSSSMLASSMMP